MGCCSVKQRDTKKTIRDTTPDMVQGEQRGEVTYVGKKPKDIIDESSTDDLMIACKNNNFALVEVLCLKFKILNVCEVRGLLGEFELLRREKYNLMYWNMILVSVAFDHLSALEFFTKKLTCHLRVSLRSPPVLGFSKMQESSPQQSEAFSILVAINNRNEQCLKYLWNDLRLLWDSYHLLFVIEEAASHKFIEGIKIIMGSQTGQEIFQSMRVQEKLKFLTELLLSRQGKRTLEVKDTIKSELSKHPYASMAIYVLINDTKNGFNVNQNHLENALANMDASEYAKFKYCKAISEFNEQVMKKVNEYSSQEENTAMRKFGENFRHKLENLDGEIVKLKNGFVNAQEYEDNLTKLFQLTEQGDLANFVKRIQDNDIRVFKRKRIETLKLTSSFAINRYSYFTPLIHAIQHKHLPLVTFMMEKMKIGLRQALCLQFIDNEENFMTQDINEEYQAYSLLAACANKDEQMLRYLWDTHGSHLWTERHFEPVMRYLIESEWCDGIRIMFKSELTVNMIKAFTSEERSFFIENMIGDLQNLERQNVARTIKEELSQKPYAGLFMVYLINDFEKLSDEDYQFWEIASENLYLSELKLLSKTNQSGFSKFILDFMIKRKDDKVKQYALKFIDKLKELPEYEPIILEGSEDAIQLGDEEVKFFKKDILECKVNYITDMIKFTITGNIKQIQKTIEQEKLTAADIYDLRGLAVKVYDYEQAMMNSREWNPVHYAIYFRQHNTLNYFINELKVNMKIGMDYSKTFNEFREDKTFDEMIGDQTHLFGLLLAVWAKDIEMMKTLYQQNYLELQINDEDLTRLFKMCIQADFAKGFLALLNSEITHYIFVNSTLDAKKELVQYILSDHCIESKCINSTKNEDQYREVKETLCHWPYACVTWLYLDPIDENAIRYIKLITENFDDKCAETLANGGQIDDFITKLDRNPQIGVEALSQLKDEEDQKNMEEMQNLTKLQSQKQKEHSDYFKRKIEELSKQQKMIMKNDLNQICEDIIKDIFEDSSLDNTEKESRFFTLIKKFKLLQFVGNFDDYLFKSKKYKKFFENLDIEKLNIVHWILFFDQNLILSKLLQKQQNMNEQCHIGMAFHGHLVSDYEYEYTEKSDNQAKIFKVRNLGVLVCILRKSIQCWETLFEESENKICLRLSPQEIFDVTLFICMENWKEGLNPIVKLVEAAFLKVSLAKRVEFIQKLLKIDSDCYKDIVRIPKILTFVEWMYENYKSKEQLNLNPGIKTLLPSFQENKQIEFTKISFLARLKPAEISANIAGGNQYEQKQQQILPNDIIDLNDIKFIEKKPVAQQVKSVDKSNDGSPLKNQKGSESEADPAEADSD